MTDRSDLMAGSSRKGVYLGGARSARIRNKSTQIAMRYVRSFCLFGMLGIVSLLGGGCVQTAMLPAQQLESGTTAASVSIDEPGLLYIPRFNAQVTQGLGGGDLSVNFSGVPLGESTLLGAGLTGRYYLTPRANAELQLQAAPLSGWRGLALFGVQEVPTGTDSWYFGGQMGAIRGRELAFSGAERPVRVHPVVGGSVGYGPIDLGRSVQMQIELESNIPLQVAEDDPPMPATRLSIGFFGLFR